MNDENGTESDNDRSKQHFRLSRKNKQNLMQFILILQSILGKRFEN